MRIRKITKVEENLLKRIKFDIAEYYIRALRALIDKFCHISFCCSLTSLAGWEQIIRTKKEMQLSGVGVCPNKNMVKLGESILHNFDDIISHMVDKEFKERKKAK